MRHYAPGVISSARSIIFHVPLLPAFRMTHTQGHAPRVQYTRLYGLCGSRITFKLHLVSITDARIHVPALSGLRLHLRVDFASLEYGNRCHISRTVLYCIRALKRYCIPNYRTNVGRRAAWAVNSMNEDRSTCEQSFLKALFRLRLRS